VSVASVSCPHCGTRPVGGRFCRSCGAALGKAPSDLRQPDQAALRDGVAHASTRDARPGAPTKTGRAPRSQRPSPSTSSTASRGRVTSDSQTPRAPAAAHGAFQERPEGIESSIQGPPLAPVAHMMSAPPVSVWAPTEPQTHTRQASTGLAVGLALAVLFVALAIAVTVILLVANGGPDRAGIVAPSSVTAPTGGGR
jgi:hypothetical protein